MSKQLFTFLFTLVSFCAFSQNSFSVKGKIIDEKTKLPIEAVTVYLSKAKDSTLVDYTITDKNGNFSIAVKKLVQPLILKASLIGFEEYKHGINELVKAVDLGLISLKEESKMLNEVVIKVEAPPIRIKKDTLEFNASSFRVRPDANVEALLKKLPGVEVTADGKIKVNGKEVDNVLVNGKPFFGADGKVATQNLPAELIEKVQVTDTKTKEEKASGQASSSNGKTINLTISEDKNKGFFGKVTGGYGSSKRYESSLLANYFKDKRKFSVLASSNNINSLGFSMNEVFDNMGGGRNNNVSYNGDNSLSVNGVNFGGNTGITRSDMVGINYTDQWSKKVDGNSSYFFSNAETKNDNVTRQKNLLPGNATTTTSVSSLFNRNKGNNLNLDLDIKLDSLTTLYVGSKFVRNDWNNNNGGKQTTIDSNDQLQNESTTASTDDGTRDNFENNLYLNKNFKKKGRRLGVSFENTNSLNQSDVLNKSNTVYYQTSDSAIVRDQTTRNKGDKGDYTAAFGYVEPVADSLLVSFGTDMKWGKTHSDRKTYNFNAISNSYQDFNEELSNDINSKNRWITPRVSVYLEKKKISGFIRAGTSVVNFENQGLYKGVITNVNSNYMFPYAMANFSVKLGKSKSFYTNYHYNVNLPTGEQILPIENLMNPLNTIIGNASIKPEKSHATYLSFNDWDYQSQSGYYTYGGADFYESKIVSSTVYDESFKAITTFQNLKGLYSGYAGGGYNKSFKKEKNVLKLEAGLNTNFSYSKGFTNAQEYQAKSILLKPIVAFTWEKTDLFTIAPNYNFQYYTTDYTNYVVTNTKNYIHTFNIQTTNYWPKHFVFGNDLSYTYNSNISQGFKKDFYLWNSSLGYNFMKDQMLFKVKVYDILNQNLSNTRNITPTAIIDAHNTVLKRYVMFSLTYKLSKFGGKEKSEAN